MNIEASFDQLIAVYEEERNNVGDKIAALRMEIGRLGLDNSGLKLRAEQLAERCAMSSNYDRVIDILHALRGAFVEMIGTTPEQDDLLRKIGLRMNSPSPWM